MHQTDSGYYICPARRMQEARHEYMHKGKLGIWSCLDMVSTSMPEKPKALSPSTATTSRSVQVAAAMAYPSPTPMVPQVPASSLSLPSTAGSNISLSVAISQQSCKQDK